MSTRFFKNIFWGNILLILILDSVGHGEVRIHDTANTSQTQRKDMDLVSTDFETHDQRQRYPLSPKIPSNVLASLLFAN